MGFSPSIGVAGSARAGASGLAGPPEGPSTGGSVGSSICGSSVSFPWEVHNGGVGGGVVGGGVGGGVVGGDCFGVPCCAGDGGGDLPGEGGGLVGGDSFLGRSFFLRVGDCCAKSADIMDILGFLPPSV